MKLDLLWWRHLRPPREHVAEESPAHNYTQIVRTARGIDFVDMDEVLRLDTGTSAFTTMLQKLANPGYTTVTVDQPLPVGTFFDLKGVLHRVESCKREESDDWFAPDRWVLGIRKPWAKPSAWSAKQLWLEDALFPRLTAPVD